MLEALITKNDSTFAIFDDSPNLFFGHFFPTYFLTVFFGYACFSTGGGGAKNKLWAKNKLNSGGGDQRRGMYSGRQKISYPLGRHTISFEIKIEP